MRTQSLDRQRNRLGDFADRQSGYWYQMCKSRNQSLPGGGRCKNNELCSGRSSTTNPSGGVFLLEHPRLVQIPLMQESAGRFDNCTGSEWAVAEGQKKSMCRVSSPRKTLFAELIVNATCCPVLRRGSKHFPRLHVGCFVSHHRLLRSTQHEPTPRYRQNRTHSEVPNVGTSDVHHRD